MRPAAIAGLNYKEIIPLAIHSITVIIKGPIAKIAIGTGITIKITINN